MSENLHHLPKTTEFPGPNLRATRLGEIVPEALVPEWFDALNDLRASALDCSLDDPLDFFRLLALSGRFERTRFAERFPSVRKLLDWSALEIGKLRENDYAAAARVVSMDAWFREIRQFSDAWLEDQIDYDEAVESMIAFLADWDDLGIILARAAERFEVELVQDAGKSRADALEWLCTKGDFLLVLASTWIQTMCQAFDPELFRRDAALDVSTHGFAALLETLEEMEKGLDMHPDRLADTAKYFSSRYREMSGDELRQKLLRRNPRFQAILSPALSSFVLEFPAKPQLAAAEEAKTPIPIRFSYETSEVRILIPVWKGESIRFHFYGEKQDVCKNTPFRFCGLEGRTDEKGNAEIPLDEETARRLDSAFRRQRDFTLEIDACRWTLQDEGELT